MSAGVFCHSERSEESIQPGVLCHSERSEESIQPGYFVENRPEGGGEDKVEKEGNNCYICSQL